jgi:hypothetical protein
MHLFTPSPEAPRAVFLTPPTRSVHRTKWSYLYTGMKPQLKSCVSHSYENCRGVGVFFPFWNSSLPASEVPPTNSQRPSRIKLPQSSASAERACGRRFLLSGNRRLRSGRRDSFSSRDASDVYSFGQFHVACPSFVFNNFHCCSSPNPFIFGILHCCRGVYPPPHLQTRHSPLPILLIPKHL